MERRKSIIKSSILTTGILYFVNKFIESEMTADVNVKTNGKYYHWKHADVFYKVYGHGKPVLLLHDLTVFSSCFEWSKIVGELFIDHTVYIIDLPGCGKSDKPSMIYTNYFYVQFLQDFVREVIKEKTAVVANGLSASFVLMANASDSNLFDNIILLNPKTIKELKKTPEQFSKLYIKLFMIPVLGKSLYYIVTNKSNTEYYLTEKCFYSPFKLDASIIRSYYISAHLSKDKGRMLFASLKGNYLNADISRALIKAENRIFLITGSQLENREETENSYLRLNKNILTLSVSKAKYLPQLEEPEQILSLFRITGI